MTDRYADTDIWPNPPASQQPARPATLAASEPSRVLGEGSDDQEAREALSEVERLRRAHWEMTQEAARLRDEVERLTGSLEVALDRLNQGGHPEDVARFARLHIEAALEGRSRPFALAERARDAALAEVTELRDRLGRVEEEQARVKRGARTLGETIEKQCRMVLDATGLHDWIDEDGDGDWGAVWENLLGLRPSAEALAEKWEATAKRYDRYAEGAGSDVARAEQKVAALNLRQSAKELRAALAVPTTGDTEDASPESGEGR